MFTYKFLRHKHIQCTHIQMLSLMQGKKASRLYLDRDCHTSISTHEQELETKAVSFLIHSVGFPKHLGSQAHWSHIKHKNYFNSSYTPHWQSKISFHFHCTCVCGCVCVSQNRTDVQCQHRWQKVLNPELIKGPWTKEEDQRVRHLQPDTK